jgi:hypothetical protein
MQPERATFVRARGEVAFVAGWPIVSKVARRLAAWSVAAVLLWTYGIPVHRAYRCIGEAPRVKTQHGCCPDDDQAADSVGRPCCERLPVVAASVGTLDHDGVSLTPPTAAFASRSTSLVRVAAVAPSRIRGGTSPPLRPPRAGTVLRI